MACRNHFGGAVATGVSGCVSGLVGVGVGVLGFRALETLRIARILREIAPNFTGRIHRLVLQSDVIAYRFSGGTSRTIGHWLTTEGTLQRIASTGVTPKTAPNLACWEYSRRINRVCDPEGD